MNSSVERVLRSKSKSFTPSFSFEGTCERVSLDPSEILSNLTHLNTFKDLRPVNFVRNTAYTPCRSKHSLHHSSKGYGHLDSDVAEIRVPSLSVSTPKKRS